MSFFGCLLKYFDSRYDMGRMMRIYDYIMNNNQINISGYSSGKAGFQKKNVSQNLYLNRDYLLMRNQERKCNSRCTAIPKNRLENRIMKNIVKEINAERKQKIKESFSRKIKSRRWAKRHHK
ncbi:MAG: hypothetical protein PHQ66_02775 [Candidatus Nanoarchaeia archaeon]|nr:hypothetical protein [Candidatus Nanoarchaeia archaeon]MDD5357709.1 hypothetical protein [Candidatus Nanoarchaeia archaeon]MDD5588628.1 hypothetical protein [Candidatus Nanoarchaeia archaeon]